MGATIPRIIDVITADRKACALGIVFFGSAVDKNLPVRNFAPIVCRHSHFVDEENCVRAGDLTGHALSESPNLFGIGVAVEFVVF